MALMLIVLGLATACVDTSLEEKDLALEPTAIQPSPLVEATASEVIQVAEPERQPFLLAPAEVNDRVHAEDEDPGFAFGLKQAIAPTVDRPQWVIVGHAVTEGLQTPMAWVSESDDIATAVPVALSENEGLAYDVAEIDNAVIVVGSRGGGNGDSPVVWRLEAGQWREVDLARMPSDVRYLRTVHAIEGTLVATGAMQTPEDDSYTAILVSNDQGVSWDRVRFDSAENAGTVRFTGIVEFGGRFIAVGWNDAQPGPGVVWASDDRGASWSRIDTRGLEPAVDVVILGSVVSFNGRLLITGTTWSDEKMAPAVWTSTDVESWRMEEASFVETRSAGDGYGLLNLATDGDRLVAHSSDQWAAEVFTSSDGITWDVIPGVREPGPYYGMTFSDLGLSLDGTVVVFERSGRPITHRNGRWARVGSVRSFPEAAKANSDYERSYVNELAWHNGRFVAAGGLFDIANSGPAARAWWSDDGEVWHRSATNSPEGRGLRFVTATSDGFVAIDTPGGSDDYSPPRLWYSADGVSWERAGTVEASVGGVLTAFDLVALGREVFVVGIHAPDAEDSGRRSFIASGPVTSGDLTASLIPPTTEPPTTEYRPITAACGSPAMAVAFMRGADRLMVSTYAVGSVEIVPPIEFENSSGWVADCQWTGEEFVAVGGTGRVAADTKANVWRSSDGESWQVDSAFAELTGSSHTSAKAVAAFDGGVVVVGHDSRVQYHSVLWVHHEDRWSIVDHPAGNEDALNVIIADVDISEGQIVATGRIDLDTYIWTAPLDNLLSSLD